MNEHCPFTHILKEFPVETFSGYFQVRGRLGSNHLDLWTVITAPPPSVTRTAIDAVPSYTGIAATTAADTVTTMIAHGIFATAAVVRTGETGIEIQTSPAIVERSAAVGMSEHLEVETESWMEQCATERTRSVAADDRSPTSKRIPSMEMK